MNGTVLMYYPIRGFGHIKDEAKDEYCFYTADIHTETGFLAKGDQVSFDVYKGHGTRAVNVRKVRKSPINNQSLKM